MMDPQFKTDVGYARSMQFGGGSVNPKLHAVVPADDDSEYLWKLLCTNGPATREYMGFYRALECNSCKRALRHQVGDEPENFGRCEYTANGRACDAVLVKHESYGEEACPVWRSHD